MKATTHKPMPQPDAASAPFFQALASRHLLLQRCAGCGCWQLGEHRCISCRGPLHWLPASGRATVHSFTIIHLPYHPAFAPQLPYNACTVELEEGPHIFSNVAGCANGQLHIGMPLRLDFASNGPDWLPVFRPAAGLA